MVAGRSTWKVPLSIPCSRDMSAYKMIQWSILIWWYSAEVDDQQGPNCGHGTHGQLCKACRCQGQWQWQGDQNATPYPVGKSGGKAPDWMLILIYHTSDYNESCFAFNRLSSAPGRHFRGTSEFQWVGRCGMCLWVSTRRMGVICFKSEPWTII